MRPLVVGFDLDMTLIDTRAGVAAVCPALSEETGVFIDGAAAAGRLGPPLEVELAMWFPPDQVAEMADRFRAIYPGIAIEPVAALPGAREAVAAVHRAGGRVVVVTGKYEPNAQLHLRHLGVAADEVVGGRWGAAKGAALREHEASIYVGDHISDIVGARAADAVSVAVATGPVPAVDLRAAAADVVLADLVEFVPWLEHHLADPHGAAVLERRLAALDGELRLLQSVAVAFSGGADSAFLLAAAVRSLGAANVVAATAVSDSLPSAELDAARAFAARLGVVHVTPRTAEMDRRGYRANEGDRCYFCKAELLDVLAPIAARHGMSHVVTGTNADDAAAGFRPGIRAAAERSARTPLLDCGFTKADVRAASRQWGLPTWDKPAAACLSSRIAYGIQISPSRLARVEAAESSVRETLRRGGLVVRDLRVRDLGSTARVELDPTQLADVLAAPDAVDAVAAAVRAAGFDEVVIDPRGFRSGALNELLDDPARYR